MLFFFLSDHLKTAKSLEFLLNNGSDPSIPDENQDFPVINLSLQQKFDFLKTIIEKTGVTLNVCNKKGVAPLIHWAKARNINVKY